MRKSDDNTLKKILSGIENFNLRIIKKKPVHKPFELLPAEKLLTNLSGGIGALFVRSILNALNINEHRIFRWRLENKYNQYIVFNHYVPNCMPKTFSFSKALKEDGVLKIRRLFNNGFFLKSTLGHSSGDDKTYDKTTEFESIVSSYKDEKNENEQWILQKKIKLKNEFRVHTFQRDVIYGLTFERYGITSSSDYSKVEIYIKKILDKLPDAILHGALIGWDIGFTFNNKYCIIEANFSGFHPEYQLGFQTSGYFQDNNSGPICCSTLNNFFAKNYNTSILSIDNSLLNKYPFLKAVMFYLSHSIKEKKITFTQKPNPPSLSALLYLDKNIDNLCPTLTEYIKNIPLIKKYYIITTPESIVNAIDLVKKWNNVEIIAENNLFTTEEYNTVKKLSIRKREQICYMYAYKILYENFCFFIKCPSSPLKPLKQADLFVQNKPINFKFLTPKDELSKNSAPEFLQMEDTMFSYEPHSIYSLDILTILNQHLVSIYNIRLINAIEKYNNIEFTSIYFSFLENINLYYSRYHQTTYNPVIRVSNIADLKHNSNNRERYFAVLN